MEERFLSLLRCPRTGGDLALADAQTLQSLNTSASAGQLANAAGNRVEQPLEAALASACGRWFYPVRDGIPVLLAEEALPGAAAEDQSAAAEDQA